LLLPSFGIAIDITIDDHALTVESLMVADGVVVANEVVGVTSTVASNLVALPLIPSENPITDEPLVELVFVVTDQLAEVIAVTFDGSAVVLSLR